MNSSTDEYPNRRTTLEKLGKKSDAIAAYKKITDAKYKAQADYRIGELSK